MSEDGLTDEQRDI
jgi:hypothetical protein